MVVVRMMDRAKPQPRKRLSRQSFWSGSGRRSVSSRSLLRDAVEVLVAAQEQVLADGGG